MHSYRHHNQTIHPLKAIVDYAIKLGESGETALLCNDRAVFLPDHRLLIISDLHLGKATYFRQAGIAIPKEVVTRDLNRLARLISHYQAERVVIAGDFFHAGYNEEFNDFLKWRQTVGDIRFDLIRGNHDRLTDAQYSQLGLHLWPSCLQLSTKNHSNYLSNYHSNHMIFITHYPLEALSEDNNKSFFICGHIHPGADIGRSKNQRLKLPCFMVDDHQLILPAFGLFTGLDTRYTPSYSNQTMNKYVLTESNVMLI